MNNFILYIILFLYIMDNLITQLSNILFLVRKDLPSQKYKDMYDIIHKIKIIHESHMLLAKRKEDMLNHMLVHILNSYKLEKR